MNVLSKTEMKKVLGGVDSIDWCNGMGDEFSCDWVCHNSDQSILIGRMTCNEARSACPFGAIQGGSCDVV